ncbi:MAG: hypothetical protein QW165_02120 [Candidatus Woesearchaeota archaeon]
MGSLAYAIAQLIRPEHGLYERLKTAKTIELNYTSRLKNGRDQWIVQLRMENLTEALAHAEKELNENDAKALLVREAQNIDTYLKTIIPEFSAKITGYYFLGSNKQQAYGELTAAAESTIRSG